MKVVFFGSPAAAIPSLSRLLEDGHAVELVITQPDKPAGRGRALASSAVKEFALKAGLRVHQPEKIRKDPRSLELLEAIRPDIGVVVAFGQIMPASVIYLPRWHTVNVHFSLLPKYRGASPVAWAILGGETRTGLTIFELNEKMDEGDILTRREVEILPRETAGELEARLAADGAALLSETLARRESLPLVPQDHAAATYAPKLKKDDGRIAWADPAAVIERKVRAFSPWPSAFASFGGSRVQLLKGRPLDAETSAEAPGRIVSCGRDGIRVGCGGGTVFLIETVRPENRREMSAADFSRGAQVKPGLSFD